MAKGRQNPKKGHRGRKVYGHQASKRKRLIFKRLHPEGCRAFAKAKRQRRLQVKEAKRKRRSLRWQKRNQVKID